MELFAYDSNFVRLAQLLPFNIQWNRKYYEAGDFQIQIPLEQYSDDIEYIMTSDRPEICCVRKVEYTQTKEHGKTVLLSGYFAEGMLDEFVVYPTYSAINKDVSKILQGEVETYSTFPFSVNTKAMKLTGTVIDSYQVTGKSIAESANDLLMRSECGLQITNTWNGRKPSLKLDILKGIDRTQGNPDRNNFITFSTEWDNLESPDYLMNEKDYRNYVIVAGQDQADQRIFVEIDKSKGDLYKRKLFVDARQERWDEEKQTLDEYKQALLQKGEEALLDYQRVSNVSLKVVPNAYDYMVDYDLGDKVECVIKDINTVVTGRIIAIYEVFKSGKHTIELEVGDKVITPLQRMKRRLIE